MKFGYTILYVDSVKDTLDFYEKAFGFKCRYLHESGDYGELETGETTLAFAERKMIEHEGLTSQRMPNSAPDFEIDFTTDDVNSALEKAVGAGAKLLKDAEVKPWGQTVAYVSDNNGYLIEICTPIN